MMDLGRSVSEIARRTGFSETTVRARAELAKLDAGAFKEAEGRGGRLTDFVKINALESVERRNKVLEAVGTHNFDWSLRTALSEERAEKNKPAMIAALAAFAVEKEGADKGYAYVESYSLSDADPAKVVRPKDADTTPYCFFVRGGTITLMREKATGYGNSDEEAKRERERERIREEHKKDMGVLSDKALELRMDFARSVTNSAAKKALPKFLGAATQIFYLCGYAQWDIFADALNLDDCEDLELADVMRESGANEERILFALAYARAESRKRPFGFFGNYLPGVGGGIAEVHALLSAFGYEPSDEEKALADGTHELYLKQ
jgi:ParB family chromosome partitioning protein